MNLKQLIVVRPPEGLFEIWTRKEYDDYMTHTVSAGAVPAYSIVTHFNEDERLLTGEELKEGGGMRWRVRNDKPKSDGYYFIKEGDNGGGRYYFETIGGGQWRWHEYSGPVGERHQFEWLDEYAAQFAGAREEVEKKVKLDLLWELIQDWQAARDNDEDINAPKFSFNDIEVEFYNKMKEIGPNPPNILKPVKKG